MALYHRGLTDVEVREHYDAGKTNMSFEISVPAHLDISDVALLGEQVIVGDGARVFDAVTAQPSALAATGAGGITLGADARSGALNSAGGALLRSGALAVGPVQLAGALSLESRAEVRGSVVQNAAAEPPRVLRWDVRWPSFSSGAIKLSPSQTSSAGPGRYRDVVLGTGAQLALSAGAYYFDSLSLDADARLYVDNASGPVRVFVRDALTYRGRIERNHQASNVLLVYLGSRNVSVEGDFDASLWAPNAVLTLHPQPSVHRGSFIGKKVNVLANARVERSPYRMLQCMGEDCQGGAAEPPLNASCSEEGLLVRRLRLDGPLANTADWVCVLSRIGGELDEETNSSEHYARLSIQKDYWSGYQTHSDVSAEAICVHRSCLLSERLSASGPYTVSAVTGVTTVPIPAPPFSFDECHESSEDHKPGGPAEEASFISEFSVTEPEGGGERVWIDQISSSRATFHATNGQCGTVRGTSYSFRSTPAGRVALFHGPIAEHVAAEAAGTFTVRSAGNRETFMPPIDEALCFLTEFGGKIRGGGEYATIAPRFDPATKRTRWHLSAHHLSGGDPDGVFASARCYSTRQDACEALAPAERPDSCDARFRQRFSWHQDTGGEIDMGPADDRACFLVRSGGHFEGGGEIVHAHVERGRWALRGNSEQTGVNATAECVAAESLSPEVPWQQGEPAKDLGSATGRACFLTRMAGHFEGGGEAIFTRIENGHWFLEGRSSQDEGGVAASARCMPVVAVGAEVTWVRGEDPKVLSTSPEDFCFITHVEGKFKGGRERVEVLLERLADGSVRQLLQGDSGQTTIVGKARCVRLATDGVVSVPDPPPALPAPDCNIVETDSYSPTFASPAVCFMSLLTEDEEGETVTRSSCRPISCFERGNQGDKVAQTAQTRVAAGEDDFGDCKHVENPLLGPNTVSFLTDADMQEAEGGGERVWIDQAAELGTTTILHANSCQGSALFNDGTIFGHAASLQLRRLDRVVQYMGPDDRVGPLNVAGEFTVQSGGTPVERPMTPVSSTTCVLTAFSGKFEGGGEFIRLDHSGSRWKLIAQHRGGDGLTATARCFLNEQPPL